MGSEFRASAFGRKGGERDNLMAAPAGAEPSRRAVLAPASVSYDDDTSTRTPPKKIALIIIFTLFGFLCLESMLSGTSLITPLTNASKWTARIIGFVAGLGLVGIMAMGAGDDHDNPQSFASRGIFMKILIVLFTPILIAVMGEGFAWRIADNVEFGFSSAPFEKTYFPVTYTSSGRKGRRDTFEIDPYGVGGTDIPVPAAQYDLMWLDASDYCIGVMARRSASGAMQIQTNGSFTMNEPSMVELANCPAGDAARAKRMEVIAERERTFTP